MSAQAAPSFRTAAVIATLLFSLSESLTAQNSIPATQQSKLDKRLREVRYDLELDRGKIKGAGAPILLQAISSAQFVLIGEPHLSREIPQFTTAVCNIMAPEGLSAMAVEVGPQVAKFVSSTLGKANRLEQMSVLTSHYGDSVAFLNVRQENDLVNHCAQVAYNRDFQLWGLDQEFLGAAGWLLDQILATHPGVSATAPLTRLKSEEQLDVALAKKTGNPAQLS